MKKGMGSHQSPKMVTDNWLTPPEIIAKLGPFDLDPCYSEPRPWETANNYYTKEEDGLSQPWHGFVWCNPPYGKETHKWMFKLAEHNNGIALIFARTETEMFIETVWGRATSLLFIHGRLYFHMGNGERAKTNSGAPSVLVAYGTRADDTLRRSRIKGTYINLRCVLAIEKYYQYTQFAQLGTIHHFGTASFPQTFNQLKDGDSSPPQGGRGSSLRNSMNLYDGYNLRELQNVLAAKQEEIAETVKKIEDLECEIQTLRGQAADAEYTLLDEKEALKAQEEELAHIRTLCLG